MPNILSGENFETEDNSSDQNLFLSNSVLPVMVIIIVAAAGGGGLVVFKKSRTGKSRNDKNSLDSQKSKNDDLEEDLTF